jgi:hypothetical protein
MVRSNSGLERALCVPSGGVGSAEGWFIWKQLQSPHFPPPFPSSHDAPLTLVRTVRCKSSAQTLTGREALRRTWRWRMRCAFRVVNPSRIPHGLYRSVACGRSCIKSLNSNRWFLAPDFHLGGQAVNGRVKGGCEGDGRRARCVCREVGERGGLLHGCVVNTRHEQRTYFR